MRKLLLATAAVILACGSAQALQKPRPAMGPNGDPHVQIADYIPGEQTLVVGAVGRSVTMTFGPTEHIQRVILEMAGTVNGQSVPAPWEGPDGGSLNQNPLGNVLPLWAVRAGHSAAQVVTKDDEGTTRVYPFLLVALPPQPDSCGDDDCDDPRLASALTFQSAPVKKRTVDPVLVAQQASARLKAAEARLKTDIFYGVRNWKYKAQGKLNAQTLLNPDQVSDNAQVTGFLYNGNRKLPSFYVVERDGSERQVTPTPGPNGLALIYQAVPGCRDMLPSCEHFRLRSGDKVVDLWNVSDESPAGVNPATGTISPEVVRVVKTSTAH